MVLFQVYFPQGVSKSMKLKKRLILKLAVLTLGLATLHAGAIPAKAIGPECPMLFCSTGWSDGHCGYEYGEDCSLCYGDDGSIAPDYSCGR